MKKPPLAVDYVAECEKSLSKQLGRGVKIVNGKREGRFELEFYGQDDLQVLLEALMTLRAAQRPERRINHGSPRSRRIKENQICLTSS